ncbi:MAG: thioredoxin-dependent phosophoadenylyl-sulfate reductase [Actinomycetia bacterium]|jgi:phosphoadenosine phosphosulfate reductase|nr:thioredoxin-dependent phosophoadenylyl-sulfate reductase [Actinomycetes bacterium]
MTQALDLSRSASLADVDLAELATVSAELERKPASAAVRWAWTRFGTRIVLASSFQDSVLLDIALKAAPDIEVVFLDTQYHFGETLEYVESLKQRYDINLTIMQPLVEPDELWRVDQNECCTLRKVEPLARALDGKQAWMTGLRRTEAATRAKAPIVGLDVGRGVVKVNPIAPWTDDDVAAYVQDHALAVHPLRHQGYQSIGCWPCTQPVGEGEDARAGRWAGTGKVECGLHGWPEPRERHVDVDRADDHSGDSR